MELANQIIGPVVGRVIGGTFFSTALMVRFTFWPNGTSDASPPFPVLPCAKLAPPRIELMSSDRHGLQRRRRRTATGTILAVLAVIAALVLSYVIVGHGKPKSGVPRAAAPASVVSAVTGVPVSALDSIGAGKAEADPADLTGQNLPSGGKPQVLYIGAEWCPFCAAERWPMVIALARFGSFSGLATTESSPSDSYPRTPTFTFYGATYTSQYLDFVAREAYSNQVVNGQYALLDRLTSTEKSLFAKGGGGFPYLNVGGKYRVGVQYSPDVLKGKTLEQIAAALSDPANPIAKAIDGSANILTAALCAITGEQPAAVCSSPTITGLKKRVGAKN